MATFPEDPAPIYPLIISPRFKTAISGFDSGKEERTSLWLFPKYDVAVRYDALSAVDAQVLWDFYLARQGSSEAFYIYDLSLLASVTKIHVDQYVGTADGSVTTFDIPGRSTSGQTIYIDGAVQSSGYSILSGGGASNSDRVQFTVAPASEGVITADFAGYLRLRVKFAHDQLSLSLFTTVLYQVGLEMKGLAAA